MHARPVVPGLSNMPRRSGAAPYQQVVKGPGVAHGSYARPSNDKNRWGDESLLPLSRKPIGRITPPRQCMPIHRDQIAARPPPLAVPPNRRRVPISRGSSHTRACLWAQHCCPRGTPVSGRAWNGRLPTDRGRWLAAPGCVQTPYTNLMKVCSAASWSTRGSSAQGRRRMRTPVMAT